jgi:hypothetical protein
MDRKETAGTWLRFGSTAGRESWMTKGRAVTFIRGRQIGWTEKKQQSGSAVWDEADLVA